MLVSGRTPLRISLFGGGTDYPSYFKRKAGSVIGMAIDKYIYLSALRLGGYVDYRYRVSYSKLEMKDAIDEIEHPVIRTLLMEYGYDCPTDFSVQADVPASAGLGSSSSFTVGFINLMCALQGRFQTKIELAREAIRTEQDLLKENVGIQDQLHAAFGGLNRFNFHGDHIDIKPIGITGEALGELTRSMVLVFTGVKRRATEVVQEQVVRTAGAANDAELSAMIDLLEEAESVLERSRHRVVELADLLHQSWALKKRLSSRITSGPIDDLYEFCLQSGALGGKLCGAGGGGFLLMVVPPERRARFVEVVGARRCISFNADVSGSQIISAHGSPWATEPARVEHLAVKV